MMRHKKTPSSEEASDDRLYPCPAAVEAVDILAGNLLNVVIFILVPLFEVCFISIVFFFQIGVSGDSGIALHVFFVPITHANRVPWRATKEAIKTARVADEGEKDGSGPKEEEESGKDDEHGHRHAVHTHDKTRFGVDDGIGRRSARFGAILTRASGGAIVRDVTIVERNVESRRIDVVRSVELGCSSHFDGLGVDMGVDVHGIDPIVRRSHVLKQLFRGAG